MQKLLTWLCDLVSKAIAEKITEQFAGKIAEPINARLDKIESRMEKLHASDEAALECDLSIMDDRICHLIGVCRRRNYTTVDERRRITRMHDAYKARGGNHGEENEYAAFLTIPTEEEYMRTKGA